MPFQQHRGRNLDIPAKFFGGMPAQEQAVEEGRLPLREVEVVLGFVRRVGGGQQSRVGFSLHRHPETEREVYRKFSRRQVGTAVMWAYFNNPVVTARSGMTNSMHHGTAMDSWRVDRKADQA